MRIPVMETEMPSPRNEPVSETVMPEWLLSETGAAVLTERLGMRVFLGIARPRFVRAAQFCSQTARGTRGNDIS